MDYAKIASQVIENVGGKQNIKSVQHCATRLRLQLKNNDLRNEEAVSDIEGVKGVFLTQSQFQIIFGSGLVNLVCDEVQKQLGIAVDTSADDEKEEKKGNALQRLVKLLSDIFVPIIPAIVAGGLLMGLNNILTAAMFHGKSVIDLYPQWKGLATAINLFASAPFTFLPVLIGFSATKKFGGNPYLGAAMGMIMVHPDLLSAYSIGIAQPPVWNIFGFKIAAIGYQGTVLPVLAVAFILATIEKKLHKIVPEVLDLFVTPLVSVFVTGYLTLSIVGPIFVWAENAILGAIQWMLTLPLGIGSLIMGGLYAPTVVTGIHQMYTAIDIGQLAKYGVTYWLPLASAANVAQGAAALAVGIKSKDKKIKSLALPSSLSAFMGITEPAIFGVNLRFFKPFIAGCIGGGCGALYASLVHLGAKGTGVTGIFGILLCLNQPLQYLIEMVIAVGVAFVISFLIYKDAEPKAATETAAVENIETADAVTTDATTADTTAEIAEETLTSPVNGTQIPLSEVADEIFASEMLGTTVAVEPADGKIVAPCDGEVSNIFETGHAVCITTESGGELLIHIGIDTVKMDGKGFTKKVSDGDKVHAGDILVEADLEEIKNAGYQTTTMMILTNTDEFGNVTKAEPAEVKTTSKVMTLIK